MKLEASAADVTRTFSSNSESSDSPCQSTSHPFTAPCVDSSLVRSSTNTLRDTTRTDSDSLTLVEPEPEASLSLADFDRLKDVITRAVEEAIQTAELCSILNDCTAATVAYNAATHNEMVRQRQDVRGLRENIHRAMAPP